MLTCMLVATDRHTDTDRQTHTTGRYIFIYRQTDTTDYRQNRQANRPTSTTDRHRDTDRQIHKQSKNYYRQTDRYRQGDTQTHDTTDIHTRQKDTPYRQTLITHSHIIVQKHTHTHIQTIQT